MHFNFSFLYVLINKMMDKQHFHYLSESRSNTDHCLLCSSLVPCRSSESPDLLETSITNNIYVQFEVYYACLSRVSLILQQRLGATMLMWQQLNLQIPGLLHLTQLEIPLDNFNKPCVSLGSCSDQKPVKSCHKLISYHKLSQAVISCQKLSKTVKNCQKP